jgi:CheY-like chemotaxis protein
MSKKVLIVDDIGFIIEFEKKVIESLSAELNVAIDVDSANTVYEAVKKVEQNDYDAIIVDMKLPDGSGVEIAKAALKKSEETRIAALTIYPKTYEEDRAYFDAFFSKPILPAPYKTNLRRLLHI